MLACWLRRQPTRWVYADRGPGRHDPSHLLSARLQLPLPALALALEAAAAADEAARGTASPSRSRTTSPSAPSDPGRPASPSRASPSHASPPRASSSRASGRPDGEHEHVYGTPKGNGAVSATTNGSSASHSPASYSSASDGSASDSSASDTNGSSAIGSSATGVRVDGTLPPAAAVSPADPPPPREGRRRTLADYRALLALVDGVAAHAIEAALEAMRGPLTEPHVARILSQHLPAGGRPAPLLSRAAGCLPRYTGLCPDSNAGCASDRYTAWLLGARG